jgi:sulfatase maturation enzyme AslB (radical SAM superfamily)
VYCGPDFSSRWANEVNWHDATPTAKQLDDFKSYIFKNAHTLKHIYLAGGEPLLMKENLELLDLIKKINPDINLRINTNLSKVDTRVFEQVCEFKNVHWIVSVETIEEEYEYIRYGGVWNDFVDNLNTIQDLDHKISFNMLYFLLNYSSVFDCLEYLKSRGFHNNSFILGALVTPDLWSAGHLPEATLVKAKERLQHEINQQPGYLLENGLRNVLAYIQQPMEKNLTASLELIQQLDLRRNINSRAIFTKFYNDIQ